MFVLLQRIAHRLEAGVDVVGALNRAPRSGLVAKQGLCDIDRNSELRHRRGEVAGEVVEREVGDAWLRAMFEIVH